MDRRQKYIDFFLAGGLPLFRDGQPNRGSSSRCAFWDGFDGIKNLHHTGIGKEAYKAGQYCRKHHRGE